jgi:hypothetical protein
VSLWVVVKIVVNCEGFLSIFLGLPRAAPSNRAVTPTRLLERYSSREEALGEGGDEGNLDVEADD